MTNKAKTSRAPIWQDRAVELRLAGATYQNIAEVLTAEGFVAKQGRPITIDTIRCRFWYLGKQRPKLSRCFWCNESHPARVPAICKRYGDLYDEASNVAESWVIMRMLENLGVESLNNWQTHIRRFA